MNKKEYMDKFITFYSLGNYAEAKEYFNKEGDFASLARDFFSALEIMDDLSRFNDALALLDNVKKSVEKIYSSINAPLIIALCDTEKYKLICDKNISQGSTKRLLDSAKFFKTFVVQVARQIKDDGLKQDLHELLSAKIADYTSFSKTLLLISSSYESRWSGDENAYYTNFRQAIVKETDALIKNGKLDLGYKLKNHLYVLDKFYTLQRSSEIYISNGSICFNYYALSDDISDGALAKLNVLGLLGEKEELEKAFLSQAYKYRYKWNLDKKQALVLKNFIENGNDLSFETNLYYYKFGLFNLSIKIDIQKAFKNLSTALSVTEYKYIQSLGSNFAVAESFDFAGKEFSFLREFSSFVFAHIDQNLPKSYAKLYLTNSPADVIANLYGFSKKTKLKAQSISDLNDLKGIFAYEGLKKPSKAIQTSIDTWAIQSESLATNLAPLSYSEDELMQVFDDQALLILPYQTEQNRQDALMRVQMGYLMKNLLSLSMEKYTHDLSIEKPKTKRLKESIIKLKKTLSTYEKSLSVNINSYKLFLISLYDELGVFALQERLSNLLAQFEETKKEQVLAKSRKDTKSVLFLLCMVLMLAIIGGQKGALDFAQIILLFVVMVILSLKVDR